MEDVVALLSIDIEQVADRFQQVFVLPSGVDRKMVDGQNHIVLKNRSRDSDFWGLVSKEKYPLLTACALIVSA